MVSIDIHRFSIDEKTMAPARQGERERESHPLIIDLYQPYLNIIFDIQFYRGMCYKQQV